MTIFTIFTPTCTFHTNPEVKKIYVCISIIINRISNSFIRKPDSYELC